MKKAASRTKKKLERKMPT